MIPTNVSLADSHVKHVQPANVLHANMEHTLQMMANAICATLPVQLAIMLNHALTILMVYCYLVEK
jgi:hypothetical protein